MAASRRFRLVIFDLGGVLVDVEPLRALAPVTQATGKSAEDIGDIFHDPALLEPFELGQIGPQDYFDEVTRRLGVTWTFERFVGVWNSMLREHPRHAAILAHLRPQYQLLILTNTNVLHDETIRSWPAFHHAHHWIASYQVGFRKPQPQIYELALRQAGVAPTEALYVDDIESHVTAARRLGVTAIQMTNGMDLERVLREAGIQASPAGP